MPSSTLDLLRRDTLDAFIIGGGINGAIAALALSRTGYRTALADKADFASFTSQSSSNLVWGGIKYLENSELFLVRQLCKARNQLFATYPHRVKEVRFTTLIEKADKFDPWQIYAGTWLYWLLGGEFTERPRRYLHHQLAEQFPELKGAKADEIIEYSDGHLPHNDARFVYRFIQDAREAGALCQNYLEVVAASYNPHRKLWQITVKDHLTERKAVIASRTLINCAGPFAERICQVVNVKNHHKHLFSKGVHLVVRRKVLAGKVVTFFAKDGRPFFVIPLGPYSCVGTTDTPVASPHAVATDEDRAFILDNINDRLFADDPIRPEEVVFTRCGVRPLAVELGQVHDGKEDWTQLSRKHILAAHDHERFIALYGGKLTDCLNVGDEMIDTVSDWLDQKPLARDHWIRGDNEEVFAVLKGRTEGLAVGAKELFARYGDTALTVVEHCRSIPAGAEQIAEGLPYLWGEVAYMIAHEQVVTLEDLLRRRSLISHLLKPEQILASPWLPRLATMICPGNPEQAIAAYRERH